MRKNNARRKTNGATSSVTLQYETMPGESNYKDSCCYHFINCIKGSAKYRDLRVRRSRDSVNSVSKIDRTARILFPASFAIWNIFYWSLYLGVEDQANILI